jgi:spore coat polysaccharide biosynthesis protein SpsF
MRIGTVIQARMLSTRFPGKSLKPLGETTVMGFMMERLRNGLKHLGPIILATSEDKSCDPLELEARRIGGIEVIRGDEHNVLSRFITAVDKFKLDMVVRITGDNTFHDPKIIEGMVEHALRYKLDLCDNFRGPMPFPLGLNLDVISADALCRTWAATDKVEEDEQHVVIYARKNTRRGFTFGYYNSPYKIPMEMRLTVDSPEDYEVIKNIYGHFKDPMKEITMESLLELWATHPHYFAPNKDVQQKFLSSRASTFDAIAPWEARMPEPQVVIDRAKVGSAEGRKARETVKKG